MRSEYEREMARKIAGKETISGWLREALLALDGGDQDEAETHLSNLMGDIRRLVKPFHFPMTGSNAPPHGFPGDQFGLDHASLKQLEGRIYDAQSFTRVRDLKSAATVIRQALELWTSERGGPTILK